MSNELPARDEAEFLPDDMGEGEHEAGESIVDAVAGVDQGARLNHRLHELSDRCLFSLAPVYQYGRVPFSLPHQFDAEFPGGGEVLADLKTHELSDRLIQSVTDGFVLQSLSSTQFRRFMLWLSVVAFRDRLQDVTVVRCDRVKVVSPDALASMSDPPLIEIWVLVPLTAGHSHRVMRAVPTQDQRHIALVVGRYPEPSIPEYVK